MKTFTIFCRAANDTGTTWIQAVEARNIESAKKKGLRECAAAWEMKKEYIAVIGVCEGSIKVLEWDDLS